MIKSRMVRLFCLLGFSAFLSAQPVRITNPVTGDPRVPGWSVDPGRGALRIAIPIGVVAAEIPIPVVFTMNGTFMSYGTYHASPPPPPHQAPEPGTTSYVDYGIFGTLGFGYIANAAGPGNFIVLEDGRTFSPNEFATYSSSSPYNGYGASLLTTYGISSPGATLQINSDASLAMVSLPAVSTTFSFQGKLPGCTSSASYYYALLDKNLVRLYATLGTPGVYVPVFWGDKFGNYVTFNWTTSTSNLPSGITAINRVDAQSSRKASNGQPLGVTIRWATYATSNSPVDLLRADFVNFEGPSVVMSGYPGLASTAPVNYFNPVADTETYGSVTLGGMVARPQQIVIGDPGDTTNLKQPSWSGAGAPAGLPPASASYDPGINLPRTWSIAYDANGASVSSITTPGGVTTTFSPYSVYSFGKSLAPTVIFGVTQAVSVDNSGKSNATHTTTWSRTIPLWTGNAWSPSAWTVTCSDYWGSVGNPRTTTLTYASPSTAPNDYSNGVIVSQSLTDGTNTSTTTTASQTPTTGGGLDGSLSFPASVTISRSGENTKTVGYTYTDTTTFLQVKTLTRQVSGITSLVQSFAYNNLWSMLEGHQVYQVQKTRYDTIQNAAMTPGTLTTTNSWSSDVFQELMSSYLDAGASYKHGNAMTYYPSGDPNFGKLQTQTVYHVENGATATSPYTVTISYDPTTGQPSQWQTTYIDVPPPGSNTPGSGMVTKSSGSPDAANRPTLITDERGVSTTMGYDIYGRVVSSATEGSASLTTTYTDAWTVKTTQASRTTTVHLDGFGRILSQSNWDGTSLNNAYDQYGRLGSVTRVGSTGDQATATTTFDYLDRPLTRTGFEGVNVTMTYSAGASGCNQVVRGFGANQVYPVTLLADSFGNPVKVTSPIGDVTQSTYDQWGHAVQVQVTEQATGLAQTRSFVYDSLGRLTLKNEPETGYQGFNNFNALNQPLVAIEGATSSGTASANSRVRNLTFDGLGRLRQRINGTTKEIFTFTGPNLAGTCRQVGNDSVSQSFSYNGPGARMDQETTNIAVTGTW